MWSGISHPGPSTAKSAGASARSGSGSWGSPPPGAARSRARRRSMDALTLGGLHIRSPAPARTASRSRANRAGASVVESSPAGVPEPHVVGHEDERRSRHRPVAQPPEPICESRPVGGEPLPDDADRLPIGKCHGGVQGRGPVPAEPDGECDVRDGGGDAVDGGQGVEALHQAAPPLGGDGTGAHPPHPVSEAPSGAAGGCERRCRAPA